MMKEKISKSSHGKEEGMDQTLLSTPAEEDDNSEE
jgi:hypothetical protein